MPDEIEYTKCNIFDQTNRHHEDKQNGKLNVTPIFKDQNDGKEVNNISL